MGSSRLFIVSQASIKRVVDQLIKYANEARTWRSAGQPVAVCWRCATLWRLKQQIKAAELIGTGGSGAGRSMAGGWQTLGDTLRVDDSVCWRVDDPMTPLIEYSADAAIIGLKH
jgi:hypothetical protein